jgi:hypothetical protein
MAENQNLFREKQLSVSIPAQRKTHNALRILNSSLYLQPPYQWQR